MTHLDTVRQAEGLPPLPFSVALHLGEILWGNIGAADRLDFTAIGLAATWLAGWRAVPAARPVGADLGCHRRRHSVAPEGGALTLTNFTSPYPN
jgi:class 3 adenylate cyclase